MRDVVLHFLPGAGSLAPHIAMREIGLEPRLVRVQRDEAGAVVEPPDYLRLNPLGRVPAVVWEDGAVQTESMAICLSVAERAPGMLAPPVDDPARRDFLRRCVFLTNTVQVAILRARYPHRFVDGEEHRSAVAAHAEAELRGLRPLCASWYDGRPWARGAEVGVDDLFLAMLIRWTRLTGDPWWDDAVLGDLFDRALDRPAARQALAAEGIEPRPPAGT